MTIIMAVELAKADASGVAVESGESGARPWPWRRALGRGQGVGRGLWS